MDGVRTGILSGLLAGHVAVHHRCMWEEEACRALRRHLKYSHLQNFGIISHTNIKWNLSGVCGRPIDYPQLLEVSIWNLWIWSPSPTDFWWRTKVAYRLPYWHNTMY